MFTENIDEVKEFFGILFVFIFAVSSVIFVSGSKPSSCKISFMTRIAEK